MSEKQKAERRILKSPESLSQAGGILLCPRLVRRDGRLDWVLQHLTTPLRTSCTFVPESLIISLLPHRVQGVFLLQSRRERLCSQPNWGFPRPGLT